MKSNSTNGSEKRDRPLDYEKRDVLATFDTPSLASRSPLERSRFPLPNLFGLILAGGQSRRMGTDKGQITYHKKPQREHLADLLQPFCEQVFISCRKEQNISSNYPLIFDQYDTEGPMNALLSAFLQNPTANWFILACDLPLMDTQGIADLIQNRNISTIATAYQHPSTLQIEPLIAIWEAKSYPILKSYFEKGFKSPWRVLKENEVHLVAPYNSDILLNVNSPSDKPFPTE
jgi:molybdopterin-guanine dinucleotide biosynthesis protein A